MLQHSFNQEFNVLEELHFKATKRPNRGFVECYVHFGRGSHNTWIIEFLGLYNAINVLIRNHIPLSSGSHNSTEWHFQGILISNMAHG